MTNGYNKNKLNEMKWEIKKIIITLWNVCTRSLNTKKRKAKKWIDSVFVVTSKWWLRFTQNMHNLCFENWFFIMLLLLLCSNFSDILFVNSFQVAMKFYWFGYINSKTLIKFFWEFHSSWAVYNILHQLIANRCKIFLFSFHGIAFCFLFFCSLIFILVFPLRSMQTKYEIGFNSLSILYQF